MNRLTVGIVASLLVTSILLYGIVARFMGTVPGLLAAIMGALLVVLAAAVWIGSAREHPSRTATVSAGAVSVVLGLALAVLGIMGQCMLSYDPGCSARFYGSVYGGISASIGGGAWMAYWAVKKRAGPQLS